MPMLALCSRWLHLEVSVQLQLVPICQVSRPGWVALCSGRLYFNFSVQLQLVPLWRKSGLHALSMGGKHGGACLLLTVYCLK